MTTFTPQNLLDQLHEIDLAEIFSLEGKTSKVQQDRIKLAKQKIKLIKQRLKEEQELIKAQWDGRNRYEGMQEKLHLAPYSLISDLISQIEVKLSELAITGKSGEQALSMPVFGTVIFGDTQAGEWHIGKPIDASRWQLKKQAETLTQLAQSTKSQLTIAAKQLQLRNTIFLLIYLIGGGAICIVLAVAFFDQFHNEVILPLTVGGLGILCAFFGVFGLIRLPSVRKKKRAEVMALQNQLREFKQRHDDIKRRYTALTE